MASLDLEKLPDVEKTGEQIIREAIELLLTETDSKESAILPEDKVQRLLVGVS